MNLGCSPTFIVFLSVIANRYAVFEDTEPIAIDDREVDKDILLFWPNDKPEPFSRVEPLHGSMLIFEMV